MQIRCAVTARGPASTGCARSCPMRHSSSGDGRLIKAKGQLCRLRRCGEAEAGSKPHPHSRAQSRSRLLFHRTEREAAGAGSRWRCRA
eukprot:265837-Chlamydomonas_euryale.AAC.1